jgi:exopolysaccharide production protein ExoY
LHGIERSDKVLLCRNNQRMQRMLKRLFDIGFSLIVITGGLPLWILLFVCVKLTSKGPFFYGDLRVGLHGKPFICWKIRTMVVNAEEKLQEILVSDPKAYKEWQENYKLKNDIRVTNFGRFLRKTSLDELPQFWNVLKGDLSVVGPRPVSQEEARLFLLKKGDKMFSIRPGITGLWQTSGRSSLPYDDRIDLEEKYIDTRSWRLDLVIIAKTVPLLFFPKGAF